MMEIQEVVEYLQGLLPGSRLRKYALPECANLSLMLLDDDYDDCQISHSDSETISDNYPNWIFCWASGHAMASLILNRETDVKGRVVLDFGSGRGVVAIAAALAGAKKIYACEIDPIAQKAIRYNSEMNKAII